MCRITLIMVLRLPTTQQHDGDDDDNGDNAEDVKHTTALPLCVNIQAITSKA
jgi:hypothetical protein